jgi:hypothetical protein
MNDSIQNMRVQIVFVGTKLVGEQLLLSFDDKKILYVCYLKKEFI